MKLDIVSLVNFLFCEHTYIFLQHYYLSKIYSKNNIFAYENSFLVVSISLNNSNISQLAKKQMQFVILMSFCEAENWHTSTKTNNFL